jgi:hypothetical protein
VITYGRVAVTLSLLVGVSGCIGSTAEPVGYDPVPDEQLFDDVESLPGVRSVDLVYTNTFTNPSEYSGDLTIERGVDPVETVDSVSAILWQGRPRPVIIVTVRDPRGVLVTSASVGLTNPTALEERYGPQPGTGKVPADAGPLPRPVSLG